MIAQNILGAIGNTPVVKLNRVTHGCEAEVYAKLEFMNPGGSIKDRIGYWLIEDAEKRGVLKPGGTIVEGTSGNTGVGLAIAAAIKGYKCIFVLPDKMSQEKIKNLRAFGARVVVTPTAVEPDDPRSYYQVSRRLARETPNAIYINQYDNLANRDCHYRTTGPEILAQMPDIDVFVAGIGTGGTICGTGKFLKEKRPSVEVVAIDPVGSIVYEHFKTGVAKTLPKTYKIEGIGEDFIPKNYDYDVISDMIQVEDKESFVMTRDLLTKEGIYSGISSGSAVVGALKWIRAQGSRLKGKKVLVVLPDSGNRYMSKAYDDDWMREQGFLEAGGLGTVGDLIGAKPHSLVFAKPTDKVSAVIELLRDQDISQVPIKDDKGFIKGLVSEGGLLSALYLGKCKPHDSVDVAMDNAKDGQLEYLHPEDPIEKAAKVITSGRVALVTPKDNSGKILAIVTKIDLLAHLAARGNGGVV